MSMEAAESQVKPETITTGTQDEKPLMSEETIRIVQATAGVVGENALAITKTFYKTMFKRNPEVLAFFNMANQRNDEQPAALAHAVTAFATYIDNLAVISGAVAGIVHKHVALSVKPEHYPIVHENMMIAIGEVLGDAVTPDIGAAWSEAVGALATILIDAEEVLYSANEARLGGWRYEREFILSKKTQLADDVIEFSFKAADGYTGGFEYDAGQFLTIRVGTDISPRHYTVTSKSGDPELTIATRLHAQGAMTNHMHKDMKVGDTCLLAPPCGLFAPRLNANTSEEKKNILISGGIGITAMKAHLDFLGPNKVLKAVHIESKPSKHAFSEEFKVSGVDCEFIYTQSSSTSHARPNMAELAKSLVEAGGLDTCYHMCAPQALIAELKAELVKLGAKKVFFEKFGTGAPAAAKS